MNRAKLPAILFLSLSLACTVTFAQGRSSRATEISKLQERLSNIETKLEKETAKVATEEELIKLQLELLLPEELTESYSGYDPLISKAYLSRTPLSIGGMGEIGFISELGNANATNLARLNFNFGFRYSQRVVLNSSFSFQNGGAIGTAGASRVEFAYIDFITGDENGIRVGNVLVPFGVTNLRPSPTLFFTSSRPSPETLIIPTTWHENGVLAYARLGDYLFQGGIVNGFNARNFETPTWIRGGRQGGSEAKANDSAYVLRIENSFAENSLGFSVYRGNASQNDPVLSEALVTLAAAHGEWRRGQLLVQALYVRGALSDTDLILNETGRAIGSAVQGGYLTVSYDLLPRISRGVQRRDQVPHPDFKELPIFVSWEHVNTQLETVKGMSADPSARFDLYTIGANYRPHSQVVIKASYAHRISGINETDRVVETGIGFIF